MVELLDALDEAGVHHWLDGGWGVDCLLGEQSRPHDDLDPVVPRDALAVAIDLLESRGYAVIRDWRPTALAFRHAHGREVDLHPVDRTPDGGGHQVLLDGSRWHYRPPVAGSVPGRTTRCASREDQLAMHPGYEARIVDVTDVHRLAERFGLPVHAPLRATRASQDAGRTEQ